jgi:hypothetical protein
MVNLIFALIVNIGGQEYAVDTGISWVDCMDERAALMQFIPDAKIGCYVEGMGA